MVFVFTRGVAKVRVWDADRNYRECIGVNSAEGAPQIICKLFWFSVYIACP